MLIMMTTTFWSYIFYAIIQLLEIFETGSHNHSQHMTNSVFEDINAHVKGLKNKCNVAKYRQRSEIIPYLKYLLLAAFEEFATDVSNTSDQFIFDELHHHCSESTVDLKRKVRNVTCAANRLRTMLNLKLERAINVTLQNVTRECVPRRKPFCKKFHDKCIFRFERSLGKLLRNVVNDKHELDNTSSTPFQMISTYVDILNDLIYRTFKTSYVYLTSMDRLMCSLSNIDPFGPGNIVRRGNVDLEPLLTLYENTTESRDKVMWGIVRSAAGIVGGPCREFRGNHPRNATEYSMLLEGCYYVREFKIISNLLECTYWVSDSHPLTWSSVGSFYVHSQCLCLAFNGDNCGVKAPQGVDPGFYCLSLLLRDFTRQVSYRPAVTYLDYAFQTRLLVRQFQRPLKVHFQKVCNRTDQETELRLVQSVQCYFEGLVNKQLNCSGSLTVDSYNETVLCGLLYFTEYVIGEVEDHAEDPVPFLEIGDSPLVMVLACSDFLVRVFTLVTYLACQELRNLPGKLLIGYLATSLLRILVVRSTLADMELAVRLDVAMDFASTLWLFCVLHFITVTMKSYRTVNSLSAGEVRRSLLRYSLLGWILPAALSAAFFWTDEVLDCHVQIGQLLFLLCNVVVLFGNLFMLLCGVKYYNRKQKKIRTCKYGANKGDDFSALFSLAVKTSVVSGAGITLRLVFTQIQGLEELLDYSYAVGKLQGLLVFLLYGCSHKARTFWHRVFRSLLPRCTRLPDTPM